MSKAILKIMRSQIMTIKKLLAQSQSTICWAKTHLQYFHFCIIMEQPTNMSVLLSFHNRKGKLGWVKKNVSQVRHGEKSMRSKMSKERWPGDNDDTESSFPRQSIHKSNTPTNDYGSPQLQTEFLFFYFPVSLYPRVQGFKSCLTFDRILKQGQVLQGHPKS